ncbi:uroporphyrinogen-III synthase [Sulfurimonas sp. SAG-AH-194-L11]|nr:uroporphyrinogen-III synthase [Sulfurimonas sp. SAG-AH-194-L11]MDF1877857.1 uroporphyrinogen-III synthase [Sulfurimonas sp. SAG-AH-194-L11]
MQSKPYLFSTSKHSDTIHVNPLEIFFFETKINFSQYDYIILTSKQSVNALKKYDNKTYADKQALCISQATAQSFRDIGGRVLEIGAGYGDNLSEIISKYPKSTKWLFLRAKEVASNFAQVSRENGYSIDEVIVYESRCSTEIQTVRVVQDATLIFTSPSSIKCFLKYHVLKENYKVIVIGKTTAKALPLYIKPIIASEPSIQSCLKLINSL